METLYILTVRSDDLDHAERLRKVPPIRDFVSVQSADRVHVRFVTRSHETLMRVWSAVSDLGLPMFGDPEDFDSFETRSRRVPIFGDRYGWVTRRVEWSRDDLKSLHYLTFLGCGRDVHTDDDFLYVDYEAMKGMQKLFSPGRLGKSPLLCPVGKDLLLSSNFAEVLFDEGFVGLSLEPITFTDGAVADPRSHPDLPLLRLEGASELPRMHPELDVREMRSGEPWTPEHTGSAEIYSTATCPYRAIFYKRGDLDAIPPFDLAMTRERLFFNKNAFDLSDRRRVLSQRLYRRLLGVDSGVDAGPVLVID